MRIMRIMMKTMTSMCFFFLSEEKTLTNRINHSVATPMPSSPKATSPTQSPNLAPQGPSQLLTALLVRLPEATNRSLIDQAAIDFAFLNSKAARKRLVKVCVSFVYTIYFIRLRHDISCIHACTLRQDPGHDLLILTHMRCVVDYSSWVRSPKTARIFYPIIPGSWRP
jgi:hypothetical protein